MNTHSFKFIPLLLMLGILLYQPTYAQSSDEDTAYWYVSHHKIEDFEKVDSLRAISARYKNLALERARQEGAILDRKVLFHHTGDEYTVVIMTKYPSWEAVENSNWGQFMSQVVTDSVELQNIRQATQWIFEGSSHYDHIYTEVDDK